MSTETGRTAALARVTLCLNIFDTCAEGKLKPLRRTWRTSGKRLALATKGFPIPQKLVESAQSLPVVPSVFHQLLPRQDLLLNAILLTRGNFSLLTAILAVSIPYLQAKLHHVYISDTTTTNLL